MFLLLKLIFSVSEILRFCVSENFVSGDIWKKVLDLEYRCLRCGVISPNGFLSNMFEGERERE